jgi:hypothetical protein
MGQIDPAERIKLTAAQPTEPQLVPSHWTSWRRGAKILFWLGAAFALLAVVTPVRTLAETAEAAHRAEAVTRPAESAPVNPRWTVLSIAPDGSWGVALEVNGNSALSRAISNCKAIRQAELGCGYRLIMSRSGWIMHKKCVRGDILAKGGSLSETEERALRYEANLRAAYAPGMPPCKLAVVIDPDGIVLARALAGL